MGTGGNFDDTLALVANPDGTVSVDAKGPSDGDVVQISIWIIQKQGASDAAATQITTMPGRGGLTTGTDPGPPPTKTWQLRALQASTNPLQPGFATAMAIALFLEDNEEQAYFWAQSVELK